jgi:hypothetical protein
VRPKIAIEVLVDVGIDVAPICGDISRLKVSRYECRVDLDKFKNSPQAGQGIFEILLAAQDQPSIPRKIAEVSLDLVSVQTA